MAGDESEDAEPSRPVGHVVIGVDDSEGSRAALRWAAAFVADRRVGGADVRCTAVTAWSHPRFDLLGGLTDADVLEAGAAERLRAIVADEVDRAEVTDRGDDADPDRAHSETGPSIETTVRAGAAAEVLLAEAAALDADLIVVGTRGRGPLANLLLGGVSRAVAARADRPVAIVPAGEVWTDGPTVVGYDGSAGGAAALEWAIEHSDGPIAAVWAWHLPPEALYDPGLIDDAPHEASLLADLETTIAALADRHPDRGVPTRVTPVIRKDDARLALLHEGKRAAAIVIGARSSTGVKGLLLGSTVDYVASHAEQVVIVVPPIDGAGDDG